MINIIPIKDLSLIRETITHPSVWPYVHDDDSQDIESYDPISPVDGIIEYLGVFIEEEFHGLFCLVKCNCITFEIHTALLKKCRGPIAVLAAKAVVKWIFDNTMCKRLITQIPEKNLLAERLAVKAGMTQYGLNPSSFKIDGVILSVKLYGISEVNHASSSSGRNGGDISL